MFEILKFNLKKYKSSAWKSKGRAYVYHQQTSRLGDYQDYLANQYVENFLKLLGAPGKILDVGAGTGVLSRKLSKHPGICVTAFDISEAMLDVIRNDENYQDISVKQGDIHSLPYKSEEFDGVISRWVIPHFENWRDILEESFRVVKEGGILAFDMPSRENYNYASSLGQVDVRLYGYKHDFINKTKNNYECASEKEIREFGEYLGVSETSILRQGFFRSNALFYSLLRKECAAGFDQLFSELYHESEKFRDFIGILDGEITPYLGAEVVNTNLVFFRK